MNDWIGALKLRLLLRGAERLLDQAAQQAPAFRRLLQSEAFVLQIRTRKAPGGYFELRNGRLQLHYGLHPQPTFTQTWRDGHAAFRVLTSKDETDLLRAYEAGHCNMSGEFRVAMWFNEAMKIARQKPLPTPPPRARKQLAA